MKFITEPSVELIAVSDIDYTKIRKFIDQHNQTFNYEGTPLDLIESAGRTCYMSFGITSKYRKV